MSKISGLLYPERIRQTTIPGRAMLEQFNSDRSRLVFCSSFRRMMQKAQVFSLEKNTSVRNRLTHSLEVADIGRTISHEVGRRLMKKGYASGQDVQCIQSIVENACLMHDIGNPPFGHFGEEAIKNWFAKQSSSSSVLNNKNLGDYQNFDGNPQGFRIITRLHTEIDEHSLNLTYSTLLASIKYPNWSEPDSSKQFRKKKGVYSSERDLYYKICEASGHTLGNRYFLAYLMELADDICYCLSDISDAFEKNLVDSRSFRAELRKILKEEKMNVDSVMELIPRTIKSFSHEVAIKASKMVIADAADFFVENLNSYITGKVVSLLKLLKRGESLIASRFCRVE